MFFAYILLSWVSRKREYAADAYSAQLVGREKMIAALKSLDKPLQIEEKTDRDSLVFSKINNSKKIYIFETHPSIEDRIQALLK